MSDTHDEIPWPKEAVTATHTCVKDASDFVKLPCCDRIMDRNVFRREFMFALAKNDGVSITMVDRNVSLATYVADAIEAIEKAEVKP